MNRRRKFLLALFSLLFIGILTFTVTVNAAGGLFEIHINGERVAFTDAEPYVNKDNRTMVPLRFISNNLGASVEWNQTEQSISIKKNETQLLVKSGSSRVIVNGDITEMDTAVVYRHEHQRTYVPLRFVSEYLGSRIGFSRTDAKGYLITVDASDGSQLLESPENVTIDLTAIAPGTAEEEVLTLFGEPDRTEEHVLGYSWWIYREPLAEYLQVAVHEGVVKEVYSLSKRAEYGDISITDSFAETIAVYPEEGPIEIRGNGVIYQLVDTGGAQTESYLISSGDYIARFYLDHHEENALTGIRLMDETSAIKLSPFGFRMNFFSDAEFIHEKPPLSAREQGEVDRSNERIMLDLVNANRERYGLDYVTWHSDIRDVALGHSIDMRANGFFDHYSVNTGNPWDRMEAAGLTRNVGENIARGQRDAVDANAALMNSLGHREIILDEYYQVLGVGVEHFHYTQKFAW